METKRRTWASLKEGDCSTLVRTVTEADLRDMAKASGDYNPIHLDEAYAKTTPFGGRIAHGLFCTGMISALLGNDLPGEGTLILKEELRFLKPVFLGDTVRASVTILRLDPEKKRILLRCLCENQAHQTVMDGLIETKLL